MTRRMTVSADPVSRSALVWAALIAPPLLFLPALISASIFFGAGAQGEAQAITNQVVGALPVILLAIQLAMLGLFELLRSIGRVTWRDLGWRLQPGQILWRELAAGASGSVCRAACRTL